MYPMKEKYQNIINTFYNDSSEGVPVAFQITFNTTKHTDTGFNLVFVGDELAASHYSRCVPEDENGIKPIFIPARKLFKMSLQETLYAAFDMAGGIEDNHERVDKEWAVVAKGMYGVLCEQKLPLIKAARKVKNGKNTEEDAIFTLGMMATLVNLIVNAVNIQQDTGSYMEMRYGVGGVEIKAQNTNIH